MANNFQIKATIMLIEENCVVVTAQVAPLLSSYLAFFQEKKLTRKEVPGHVEFRQNDAFYSIWIEDAFVGCTDVIPFNDVYVTGASILKRNPLKMHVVQRTAALATVLDKLVKSCTDDKGVPIPPTQEAVDDAKSLLIQYQFDKLRGE